MNNNWKDILSNLSPEIDQELLLQYLQDKLPAEKSHEVEKQLLENEFAGDAVEGLKQFHNQKQIEALVDQLNNDLQKKLQKKKRFRDKLRIKDQPWIYIATLIILLLIVIAYILVRHRLLHS